MDSNLIGCIAEYKFATEAMDRGFFVSFPLLDTSPYDCIVETEKGLKKIQIKSVTKEKKSVRCFLRKTNDFHYLDSEVDFFAIYVRYHNGFYIFKNEAPLITVTLNKEGKSKKYFNNFVFD